MKTMGAALLLLFAAGCAGGRMAMGQGAVTEGKTDDAKALDAPLAVGGSIQPDVRLDLKGTATPALVLVSANPEVVAAEGGYLTGRAPGVSAVLVTTQRGEVLDFYHVWVEPASRATLHRLYADGRDMGELREGMDLLVGEAATLEPKVYAGSQQLAGTVDGTWRVEPPLAEILSDGVGQRRRLVARKPGAATLRVSIANVVVSTPLRILEAS